MDQQYLNNFNNNNLLLCHLFAMSRKENKTTPFPIILHEILRMCEMNNYEDIISWQPSGRSFKIRNPDKLSMDVLPLFFQHNNIKSFMRQLYYYNFHRIKDGDDEDCYYHELFTKENKSLAKGIIRKTRKVKPIERIFESSVTINPTLPRTEILPCNQSRDSFFEEHDDKANEVDLYAPNLRRTSIFMDNPDDDLEFGVVLKLLSLTS